MVVGGLGCKRGGWWGRVHLQAPGPGGMLLGAKVMTPQKEGGGKVRHGDSPALAEAGFPSHWQWQEGMPGI